MLGSTRSGGLWPSTKVRMLMMTFSPISARPSCVAEPMCGTSVTLPIFASPISFSLTAGGVLNHSESVVGEFACLQHPDQRVLVDDLAACGVDENGVGTEIFQPAG